jgi:hypothetical protein
MIETYKKIHSLFLYLLDKKGLNWCVKIDLYGFIGQKLL